MNCYVFELKSKLSETEILECFEFMKSYLISIYGEEAISEQNFLVWKSNIEKINKNRYFIKISKEKETCGYAQISITENNTLYFGDIIIKESMRRTRVVYEFVKYVLNLEEFKHFEEIYLLINKNNKNFLYYLCNFKQQF